MVHGARVCQGARCGARWCALVRCALVRVGAVRVGASDLACTHPRNGARVVGKGASTRCGTAFERCASLVRGARRCVGAVRVARRCVPFLRVVASLWLTVRRCVMYGAVVVSVSLHGTSNPGNPHGARRCRFTRARPSVAPSRRPRRFRRWCVAFDSRGRFLDLVPTHQQRRCWRSTGARRRW